jgi:hypothetical protein
MTVGAKHAIRLGDGSMCSTAAHKKTIVLLPFREAPHVQYMSFDATDGHLLVITQLHLVQSLPRHARITAHKVPN